MDSVERCCHVTDLSNKKDECADRLKMNIFLYERLKTFFFNSVSQPNRHLSSSNIYIF